MPSLLNICFSVAVMAVAIRWRTKQGAWAVALLMVSVTWWSLGLFGEFTSTTIANRVLWSKFEYVGITSAPIFLLAFTLTYIGAQRWLTPLHLTLYSLIPATTTLLAWTNEWHHMIWTSFAPKNDALIYGRGPWFWVMVVYAYLVLMIATVSFLRTSLRRRHVYRRQAILISLSIVPPWLANMLYVLPVASLAGWDLTPFGFSMTGLLILLGLWHWRLLALSPIARDFVIENMPQGVIVVDQDGIVADVNTAALELLGGSQDIIGQPVHQILGGYAQALDGDEAVHEVTWDGDPPRILRIQVMDLYTYRSLTVGRAILCEDVTARRQAQIELADQQRMRAVAEERERVSVELHASIRQVLGDLSTQAQAVIHLVEADETAIAVAELAHLVDAAQAASQNIDEFMHNVQFQTETKGFFPSLKRFAHHFGQSRGILVRVSQPDEPAQDLLTTTVQIQLLFIVQEMLTLAAHTQAHTAEVVITRTEACVYVVMTADGEGLDLHSPEVAREALATMKQRAEVAGANLDIRSTPDQGLHVIVRFPLRYPTEAMPLPPMRMLLVDDHQVLLESFRELLEHRGVEVVGTANSGQAAIAQTRELNPDVILMDIRMPDMSGIDATRIIKAEYPDTKIIFLTSSHEKDDLLDALQTGASGYLLKTLEPDEFFSLLTQAVHGKATLDPAALDELFTSLNLQDEPISQGLLSDQQVDVLRHVAQGLTYQEIGAQMHISTSTVRYHMNQIRERLHVTNRAEAVAQAIRLRILQRPQS